MAIYQKYNTFERIISFKKSFPKRGITAYEFADAGFFYSGIKDNTICFFCGVGLQGWENTDNPLKQHAKFSPHCAYILDKMGNEFVQNILGKIIYPLQDDSDMEIALSLEKFHQFSFWKITRNHKLSEFTGTTKRFSTVELIV